MRKILLIIFTMCVMVTTITSHYEQLSHRPTTTNINTSHVNKRSTDSQLSSIYETVRDDQFKTSVVTTLREIKENVVRNADILQKHKNAIEVLQENSETQHQRQETIQQIQETIRRLEEDYRLREETSATQLRKAEESHARCETQVQQLTQHNEEVTNINSTLSVNNKLLENMTQDVQELQEKQEHQLQECQQNLTKRITRIMRRLGARDCTDIQHEGETESGVYQIFPHSSAGGVSVLCKIQEEHMWTVFLARQRQTTQVNFTRTWQDYKTGFGDPRGEYWLGNDNLHALTSGGHRYRLKVIATNLRGEQRSAVWETFSVADEANKYRVTVGGYTNTSTLGDPLASDYIWPSMNGSSFTTVDSDNDDSSGLNCAETNGGGGWWYNNCAWVSPTAPLGNTDGDWMVMSWHYFNPGDGRRTGLSQLLMMITTTTTTSTTTTQH